MGDKMSAGRKIIKGLKEAIAGNFARVTIEGQRWVKLDEQKDAEIERLKDECAAIRAETIEECALIADKYWAREVASQIRTLHAGVEHAAGQ